MEIPEQVIVRFPDSRVSSLCGREVPVSLKVSYAKRPDGVRVCDKIVGSVKGIDPTDANRRMTVVMLASPFADFQSVLSATIVVDWLRNTIEEKVQQTARCGEVGHAWATDPVGGDLFSTFYSRASERRCTRCGEPVRKGDAKRSRAAKQD